jgi:hypothetical protein
MVGTVKAAHGSSELLALIVVVVPSQALPAPAEMR